MIQYQSVSILLVFLLAQKNMTLVQAFATRSRAAVSYVAHSRSTILYYENSDSSEAVNGASPPIIEPGDEIGESSEEASTENSQATILKNELLVFAEQFNRGFQATQKQRDQVKDLIFQLAPLNPTLEPASPYYENASSEKANNGKNNTLSGKWTLIYTDAPDITGLDTSRNLFSTAQLGRIGQECNPPYIKNVIEWKRPEWAKNFPFSGGEETRVLQKVVTSASSSPDKPRIVNLKVAGLELNSGPRKGDSAATDLTSKIQQDGLIAGLLSANPVDLKGPLNPPFGRFEVLYLDSDLRIVKTSQSYVAVNRRISPGEEWF